ncbi:MAG TPA: hypothetical protein VMV92_30480 [Streptosporangiaceae bacterium]|nr:hypothetical protein [Streptosporangiaceae bacterium]
MSLADDAVMAWAQLPGQHPASADQVVAFRATGAAAAAAPSSGASSERPGAAATSQASAPTGGLAAGGIAGIAAGALVVLGGIGWLLRRRLGHSNG